MNEVRDPGTITVTQTYKKGRVVTREEQESSPIEVTQFHTDTARVSFTQQVTVNMGDFESVKTGVTCTLPAYVEEIDAAFEAAEEFVRAKLDDKIVELQQYRDAKRKKK